MTSTTTYGTTAIHYPIHNMLRAKITGKENVLANGTVRITFDILNGEDPENPDIVSQNEVIECLPELFGVFAKERLYRIFETRKEAEKLTIGMEVSI